MAHNAQEAGLATKPQALEPPCIAAPDQKFVTVLVGPSEVRWVIHEKLLVHYSPYFRAAFQGKFKEAEEKTIRLKEAETDTFEIFVHWLYAGSLPNKSFAKDNDKFKNWFDDEGLLMGKCILVYIFADKYDVEKLRLDCINDLFRFTSPDSKSLLGPESSIILAFATLPSKDPLCRMITDIFCEWANVTKEEHLWSVYTCVPFLQSLWKRFHEKNRETAYNTGKRVTKEQSIFGRELCYYHDHADEEEKEVCKEHRQSRK